MNKQQLVLCSDLSAINLRAVEKDVQLKKPTAHSIHCVYWYLFDYLFNEGSKFAEEIKQTLINIENQIKIKVKFHMAFIRDNTAVVVCCFVAGWKKGC